MNMRDEETWYSGFPTRSQMRPLAPNLACFVSRRISADGQAVVYMVRLPAEPGDRSEQSGCQFLAGDEGQEYLDSPDNIHLTSLNTIANHDPAVVPFLEKPRGTAWGRANNTFVEEAAPW